MQQFLDKINKPVTVPFLGGEITLKRLTVGQALSLETDETVSRKERTLNELFETARLCFPDEFSSVSDDDLKQMIWEDGFNSPCSTELLKQRYGGAVNFLPSRIDSESLPER